MRLGTAWALWILLGATVNAAAPRITEIVAANSEGLTDGTGRTPDWIEIHNPDATPRDLSGYTLTDDPEQPARWAFPPGVTIPAGGYLVVFASSSPTNFVDPAGWLHATFSLDQNGEYLAFHDPQGAVLQEFAPALPKFRTDVSYGEAPGGPEMTQTVLTSGAAVRWRVPSAEIGTSWRDPDFDDTAWTAGQTGIGYGYPVGAGGDTRSAMWFVNATVYARIPFQVQDAASVSRLVLRMKFDDGFAAFINGYPVASSNAPATLAYNSAATAQHPDAEAAVFKSFSFSLPAGVLRDGSNVLAVHGLNFSASGANSSDFYLLPELDTVSSSDQPVFAWFRQPTPGAVNSTPSVAGFVADTTFSVKRGWKTEPFSVAIATATPGAVIRYTLDGSTPTATNGLVYAGPVNITNTTILRATASKPGFESANVDSQSYLFLSSVLAQPSTPPGYPTTWAGRTADYAMDPEVVENPAYAGDFADAFAALPTLSLSFDRDAFFHPTTGIYQQPQSQGDAWERPVSVEFLPEAAGESGFQIDGGARIQGSSSRSPDTPKHSLSLRFRKAYGDGKLSYPLFRDTPHGAAATTEFDFLQLRPEYNFGWMHRHYYQCAYAQYGRDQWASDLFLAMGRNGMRGRWVHLFLNGLYWGLYDLHERPDADYMASYFGGVATDYDTVNSAAATDGDLVAFNAMMDLAYGSISTTATYDQIQQYLDLDAFIDYMLVNAYVGNRDWDGHNWRAARMRAAGAPYLFFPWDSEFAISHVAGGVFNPPPAFESTALNTDVTSKNLNRNPTGLQTRLQGNAEYRLRYADHVRRHLFNGGVLTPGQVAATWMARATNITRAIVAESARWGDFRRDVDPGQWASSQFALYTRDQHFLPVQQWLLTTYFPQRTGIVLGQLRSRGLYPATDAPNFSQYGGRAPRGFQLDLTATATIHYTTDGTDPRLPGGNVSATAQTGTSLTILQSTQVKARARSTGGEWSALTEAFFTVGTGGLALSEIMYHPAGNPAAEFIEIVNEGAFPVALNGLRFTDGITFDFSTNSSLATLAPGRRLLIVRDLAAFQSVYGNAHDASIAGTFQNGSALNNGGETITLADASGAIVFSVTYGDNLPWSPAAAGAGHSLVFTGGDTANPLHWRPSAAPGGNPAGSDVLPPAGADLLAASGAALALESVAGGVLRLAQTGRLGADDVVTTIQSSSSLAAWTDLNPLPPVLARRVEGDREVLVWGIPTATMHQFYRLRVERR